MPLPPSLRRLLAVQDGVVARHQVLAAGWDKHDVDRMVRRREWVRLLPGVYVDHTGPPTWEQRAWAGVLHHAPAALASEAAIRVAVGGGDVDVPITIAVASTRNVVALAGYRLRYLSSFEAQVLSHLHPPRVRLEEAVLDVAAARSEIDRVRLLTDACRSRRTTAERLLAALATRSRYPHRAWVEAVLRDAAAGTASVLEHRYLTQVERSHGLPVALRQISAVGSTGRIYRDASYLPLGLHVELDGRLFHDTAGQRDRDLERDLDAVLDGFGTVRLGWGQVVGRPCGTAAKLARLFSTRGWTGTPRPCGPDCELRGSGASGKPDPRT